MKNAFFMREEVYNALVLAIVRSSKATVAQGEVNEATARVAAETVLEAMDRLVEEGVSTGSTRGN